MVGGEDCVQSARSAKSWPVYVVASMVVLAAAGCGRSGPELGSVTGTVTLDGQPLPGAVLVFTPAAGRVSRARTGPDGTYELRYAGNEPGALVGEHKVTISTRWMDEDVNTGKIVQIPEKIPAKYNDKSDLVKTVESGSNTIDFAVTSK